jgi:4-hydroxyproline epimerase
MKKIRYVDSHTGGEPTRVVLDGFPELGALPLAQRVDALRADHDDFRAAVASEPRASDVMVGALLMPPVEVTSVASVIYFNNVGYLGMCGHGTIGLIATLHYLGRISPGVHRVDTPVGTVSCTLRPDGKVSIQNIPSWRYRKAVIVNVEGYGPVSGDVAWGGNWFYLVDAGDRRMSLDNIDALLAFSRAIRHALVAENVTGPDGEQVDHIELFGVPSDPALDSRNFVLCPGSAYDRSPCGTGTSAKLACLAADGKLAEGATWRQESIVGSVFEGSYRREGGGNGGIVPTITGQAFVCGEGMLLMDPADPFCWGIH